MKLSRINIRSLPGIRPGFSVDDFDPGTNFVTGPNAIGKSSLVRALRYLLREPRSDDPRGLSLSAEFRDHDSTWTVHREGSGESVWERDGRPSKPPTLPPADAIASHLVTVEDLISIQGDDEKGLATVLRRELHGGFDLPTIRNDETFKRQPRIGHGERRELNEARSSLAEVEREHAELHRQQESLPDLAEKINQAEAAGREAEYFKAALDLLEATREQTILERELKRFPEDMEKLGGREASQLDDIEQRLKRQDKQRRQLERRLRDARQALTESGLTEKCPGEQDLELARDRLSRLETLENQIAGQRETIARLESRRDSARARLGGNTESMPKIDDPALDRARELARGLDKAERVRNECARLLEAQPENQSQEDPERLRRGADLLRDWLAAPAPRAAPSHWKPAAALGGIGAVAAMAGGLVGRGWLAILGGVLMLIAVVMPRLMRTSSEIDSDPAEGIRENYRSLRLPEPVSWTRRPVLEHLRELDDRLLELGREQQQQRQAIEWRRQIEHAENELDELKQQCQALGEELGFDPALTRRLDDFLQRVREWQQYRDEVAAARTRLAGLGNRTAGLRKAIGEFLEKFPGEPPGMTSQPLPERLDELAAIFRELRKRSQQAREAVGTISESGTALRRLKEEIALATSSRERLYHTAGLADGQKRELEQRLAWLDEWRDLHQDLVQARRRVEDRKTALQRRPDLIELAEAGDADKIASQLQRARKQHEDLDDHKTRKTRIETEIRNAQKRHDREAAMAAVQARETALAHRRDEQLAAEAAQFLLDEIEAEYRSERQPPLLKSARRHFASFTHYQWELDLDESDDGSFRARDTVQQAWRRPGELSTATRMQMLLALRLAHAEATETDAAGNRVGAAVPLIIDEALTTSDFERAGVILGNLNELADQGRQVIYLATGDHEYQLWQQATGRAPHLIDLARIRRQLPSDRRPRFELPRREPVPEPGDADPTEYARRLGVPAPDPREPAESLHVFYMMPEHPSLVHRLMQDWRIEALGSLENLLQSSSASHAIGDEQTRMQLAQSCRIARAWVEAWRFGRGKPVDRGVLENAIGAGGLTEATIDGVAEIANQAQGDAEQLLKRLQDEPITMASGNRRRLAKPQLAGLSDYLTDQGCLDERQPLERDERRRSVLQKLAGDIPVAVIGEQVDWLDAGLDG